MKNTVITLGLVIILLILILSLIRYFFGEIPVAIITLLSGLTGASIAIHIANLQNKANAERQQELLASQEKQQLQRLDYEAAQKKLDREMNLRREIFLGGVTAYSKMQDFIASFIDINVTSEARSKIIEGASQDLNKVEIIATMETLEAIDKMRMTFISEVPKLTEKRAELDLVIDSIAQSETSIEHLKQINDQLIALLNQETPMAFEQINQSREILENNNKEINTYLKIIRDSGLKIDELNTELMNHAIGVLNEFLSSVTDAIICIRRELDFTFDDEEKYRAISNKLIQKSAANISQWHQDFLDRHKDTL